MGRWAIAGVVLTLVGCGRDFSVPDEVEGPIRDIRITPNPAPLGVDVNIEFLVTREASADPEVTVLGLFAARVSGPDAEGSYRYLYPVRGTEPENQDVAVAVSVPVGASRLEAQTSVRFDFTSPVALSVAATPDEAGLGDTVTLELRIDQDVVPPDATVQGFAFDCGPTSGFVFTCTYTTTGDERPGNWDLALHLEDAAGNTTDSTHPALGVFRFDNLPQITNVVVEPAIARAGATLAITFSSDRMLTDATTLTVATIPATRLTETPTPNGFDYAYEYPVTGNESEGTAPVQLVATDQFGGTLTVDDAVEFDFTPPTVTSVIAVPAVVGTGQTVSMTLTADEPLSGLAATIGFPTPLLAASCRSSPDPAEWSCDYRVRGIEPEGLVAVLFGLTDRAGNLGTTLQTDLLEFKASCAVRPGARVIRSATAPDRFEALPGTFDPGAVVSVLLGPGGAVMFTATAETDGSVVRVDLPLTRPEVWFIAVDSFGNTCAETRASERFVASFEGKTRGDVSNPSLLRATTIQEFVVPLPELASVAEASAAVYAGSAFADGSAGPLTAATLAVGTTPRWYEIPLGAGWPSPRAQHMATYDLARRRMVVFGGSRDGWVTGIVGETWLYDGRSWTEATTAGPPPRCDAAFEYHAARQETILVSGGGCDGSTTPLHTDMWIWNGATWTTQTYVPASPAPVANEGQTVLYDSLRGQIVTFGGTQENDTHAWDGGWTLLASSGLVFSLSEAPWWSNRGDAAYDSVRDQIVQFGGKRVGFSVVNGDTWLWDGSFWSRPGPAVNPPANLGHAIEYDPRRDRTVLTGGLSSGTWEWDGATWNLALTVGGVGEPPSVLENLTLTYDAYRGRLVSFGGENLSFIYNEIWEYSYPFEIPVLTAHLSTGTFVATGATLEVSIAGSGSSETSTGLTGAIVYVWNRTESYWEQIATSGAALGSPSALTWTVPIPLSTYISGNALDVLIRPTEGATHLGPATLELDYIALVADE